jgi:hypothetical protein
MTDTDLCSTSAFWWLQPSELAGGSAEDAMNPLRPCISCALTTTLFLPEVWQTRPSAVSVVQLHY